jgi:hypothetical protein
MGTVVYAIGRIAIVITFIVSGVVRLMDIGGTGAMIASKVLPLSEPLAGMAASIEATVGLPFTKVLVIAGAALEIVAGLLDRLRHIYSVGSAGPLRLYRDQHLLLPQSLGPPGCRAFGSVDPRTEQALHHGRLVDPRRRPRAPRRSPTSVFAGTP